MQRIYLFFMFYSILLTIALLFMKWSDEYTSMIFAALTSLVFVFTLPAINKRTRQK